ncbi:hypothetical protein AA0Z99_01630 [Agrococcus sp. 1P02AA]|uniref:hypothetical protein n=1 Tax=Agrococcus sp. 1P02AA TaxID=3132259 RepID=UPI0039A666D9
MRRFAMSAAAVVVATLALAGCATADEPSGPQPPNGFTLAATLDDGSLLWSDLSEGSGLTDLILESPEGGYVHTCLGSAPRYCWDDWRQPTMLLVIAPPDATEAVLQWYGQSLPLTAGTPLSDEAPAVFALRLPEYETNEQGWTLEVRNAAGEAVMTS